MKSQFTTSLYKQTTISKKATAYVTAKKLRFTPMKTIFYISTILISLLLTGCEDVVNVDLDTAPPKLVIDASINWEQGTDGAEQKIKLTTTTSYYSATVPTVSGATVSVKNSNNTVFNFVEVPNSGVYVCNNFIPQINEAYTLTVVSNGQTYTATEILKSVAPINEIIQNNEGGITGDQIEIKAFFDDPADEENYYMFKYKYSNNAKLDYQVSDDRFFQGNTFFSLSNNDDLRNGNQIDVTHYGVSKTYYNYMNILLSVAGNTGGGPFQSPPATVRGNIINTTNFDNYALGYFRLSETDSASYIIE
jgi:hypothetical protein